MKFEVTKKQMRDEKPMIAVSYCGLQYLLGSTEPIAYSAGVYGWACDYYKVESSNGRTLWISTGFAPIGDRVDYKITTKFNDKARHIACSDLDCERRKNQTTALLKEFADEVLKDER